jgi:glycosyltransferase involved in cell wall biosynthesis
MLGPAARRFSAWKKRPLWWLAQRRALEAADCLHATAASEYEEMRAAGLKNPVAIIPNGIHLPDFATVPRHRGSDRIVLSLGRIHPKKGLDRLVRAWAKIEAEFPSWRLRLVGPAEAGHAKQLAALAGSLGLERVSIEGPIYDAATKLSAYRSADLFVLPTLNENFALTVAEALAAEVPVISTKGAPWAGLETQRCGWWIDHGVEPLAAALRHAMTIRCEARQAMGARGRAWMAADFGWDRVAADMLAVYVWLKSGGEPPPSVRVE